MNGRCTKPQQGSIGCMENSFYERKRFCINAKTGVPGRIGKPKTRRLSACLLQQAAIGSGQALGTRAACVARNHNTMLVRCQKETFRDALCPTQNLIDQVFPAFDGKPKRLGKVLDKRGCTCKGLVGTRPNKKPRSAHDPQGLGCDTRGFGFFCGIEGAIGQYAGRDTGQRLIRADGHGRATRLVNNEHEDTVGAVGRTGLECPLDMLFGPRNQGCRNGIAAQLAARERTDVAVLERQGSSRQAPAAHKRGPTQRKTVHICDVDQCVSLDCGQQNNDSKTRGRKERYHRCMDITTQETHADRTVGRFAPTPSGRMHMGNAFALLMAWLGARAEGGRIILRIEDLDPRAQDRDVAQLLIDDLAWLGLDWDEGPYWQSERGEVYTEAIARLEEQGLTYPCFCTRSQLHAATAPHASDGTYVYTGTCRGLSAEDVARLSAERAPATRMAVPDADDPAGHVEFEDAVFGHRHEVLARDCGDFLVRRSDGVVAYQLAVAVDDALMGVTQVVRGRDLLGSTARQMWIQRSLGLESPTFAHVPLLVAADGRRLAKRDRDLDLGVIRGRGVRPEQVVGWLGAHVGLCPEGVCARPGDLLRDFSWEKLRKSHDDVVVDSSVWG